MNRRGGNPCGQALGQPGLDVERLQLAELDAAEAGQDVAELALVERHGRGAQVHHRRHVLAGPLGQGDPTQLWSDPGLGPPAVSDILDEVPGLAFGVTHFAPRATLRVAVADLPPTVRHPFGLSHRPVLLRQGRQRRRTKRTEGPAPGPRRAVSAEGQQCDRNQRRRGGRRVFSRLFASRGFRPPRLRAETRDILPGQRQHSEWSESGSIRRPRAFQARALPTELSDRGPDGI
jgi:hypothetical protein